MVDFKIRRGLSTTLFNEEGIVNPLLIIEEGCWYLCTDTAELFLGVPGEGGLTLKRINGENSSATDKPAHTPSTGPVEPNDDLAELEFAVGSLQDDVAALKEIRQFKKIDDSSELPDINSDEFNPYIIYYMQQVDGEVFATYIYDDTSKKYLCIHNRVDHTDVSVTKTEINAAGELIIYYSNGDIYNLGRVVGKDGNDGIVTKIKIGDKIYSHTEGIIELSDVATKDFVRDAIAEAELGGGEVDLSKYATKEDLIGFASEEYVDEKIAAIEHPEFPSKIILFGGDATPEND